MRINLFRQNMDEIKDWAEYYQNMHVLDDSIRAVVLMENMEDKVFWDVMLQRYRPGEYMYIGHDNSLDDSQTIPGGCTECLKYKDYLTPFFFICMDTDMSQMLGNSNMGVSNYICQTYTYSWENHCCESSGLQNLFCSKCSAKAGAFDFKVFLKEYSKAVYIPMLTLLACAKNASTNFTISTFCSCIPKQCKRIDLANNGEGLIVQIKSNFASAITPALKSSINYRAMAAICKSLRIDATNAYLHTRGHDIFNLLSYMGKLVCKGQSMNFERDVMLKNMTSTGWEMVRIEQDLRSF